MFTDKEMTKEERIEYWEMVLEEFRQSGLNKTTYCQRNDIPVSTLNYWANRIKDIRASKEAAGDRFIELPIPEGNAKIIRYSNADGYIRSFLISSLNEKNKSGKPVISKSSFIM